MLRQCVQSTSSVAYLTGSHLLKQRAAPPAAVVPRARKIQLASRGFRARSVSAVLGSENMSLKHIPADSLEVSKPTWWLESRFHFSFAEYYNPSNVEFGVLRVLNDDLVKPRAGFGTHPHRDMEICTYIVDGKLTHKDSMGTAETLGRGSVQYMSAGTGVTHSEMNNDGEMLRFLQIWIKPSTRGLKPNYGSRVWKKEDRRNQLQHLVTDFKKLECGEDQHTGVIPIHQDANMYVSEADPGLSQTFTLEKRRQVYLVCIEGGLTVNGTSMDARDAMTIRGNKDFENLVELKADDVKGAHFFIIDMALA